MKVIYQISNSATKHKVATQCIQPG